MADILIKGLALPKKGEYAYNLQINSNGIVEGFQQKGVMVVRMKATAIELPSHGRLVDADELEASDAIVVGEEAWNMVHNAPTVLEANYGSDN